jgi:hypothetical protein
LGSFITSNVAIFCNIWKVSLHPYVFITWSFSKYMFSFFLCVHNFCLNYVSKLDALKSPSMLLFPFYSLKLSYILKTVMFYVCQYTNLICMYYGMQIAKQRFLKCDWRCYYNNEMQMKLYCNNIKSAKNFLLFIVKIVVNTSWH